MRRRLAAAVAAAAITALVASCTTSGGDTATDETGEGPVSLTFWNTGTDENAASLQAAADLYKQSHPTVTIKVQSITWDDGHAKVLAAASARSGPDIISGGLSWGIEFGSLGGMLDLRKYGIDEIQSQTKEGLWSAIKSTDGSVYGVPLDTTLYLVYYRTDLLRKAGIAEPPKTWDELTTDLARLKSSGLKTPLVLTWGTFEWLTWFNYFAEAGGQLYDPGCTKPTIDSEQGVIGTRFWADLFRKYGAPTQEPDPAATLAKGDTAFVVGGSWLVNGMDAAQPKLKGKWATAPMPAGPAASASFVGGRIVGVMSYTKAPKAAAEFVKWLYTDQAIQTLQKENKTRGNELWLSPRVELMSQLEATDNIKSSLQTALTQSVGPPPCKGWETSGSEVTKRLQAVVSNNVDPKKALTEAAQIMATNLK